MRRAPLAWQKAELCDTASGRVWGTLLTQYWNSGAFTRIKKSLLGRHLAEPNPSPGGSQGSPEPQGDKCSLGVYFCPSGPRVALGGTRRLWIPQSASILPPTRVEGTGGDRAVPRPSAVWLCLSNAGSISRGPGLAYFS